MLASRSLKETRNQYTPSDMTDSSFFRIVPATIERKWTTRDVTMSSAPNSGQLIDTKYESPLTSLTLSADFLDEAILRELMYAKDDNAFASEWEFAEETWNELMSTVNDAVSTYNKKLVARAKELGLNNASILGSVHTRNVRTSPPIPDQVTIIHKNTRPVISSGNFNRIETIYEPSIRSTRGSTRTRHRRASVFEWMAGAR